MPIDPWAPRSAWRAAGLLFFAACVSGCKDAPFRARAVYGPELEFRATESRDSFDEVYWNDPDKKQPACPVVVHFPGADLGDEQLRSTKAVVDLGAREVSSVDGREKARDKARVTVLSLDRNGAQVSTFYQDDRLTSVIVRVKQPTPVTVNGKKVTLPLARGEMIEQFGPPARMIE
ncbi:MAG: hypothetical protein J0I06_04835 [Planctomycetes bacterium]|nr:hypothetical protein [Planctomycetota bacterium]